MKYPQTITRLKKYLPIYILTIVTAFIIRYFYKINDSDALIWILAPTSRWSGILCGISFEYLPHMGYVNHFYQFLIAPSCSGIRFMLLVFIMLTFSFIHQMEGITKAGLWFISSAVFSYLASIFVNGIRIAVSIKLPLLLNDIPFVNNRVNPDKLHTIIGTCIYFLSLCIIYLIAAYICQKSSDKLVIPAFCYFAIVLALPFLKRIYYNEWNGFRQYAQLITVVCFIILFMLHLIILTVRRIRRK